MKTTLKEKLAEIYESNLLKSAGHANQNLRASAMRAVLDHLASMEVPSVEDIKHILWDASRDFERGGTNDQNARYEAVRNAIVPPLVAKVAVLEAKLEAVNPLNLLIDSLVNDQEYAWGWHCNIAMAAYDAGARPHQACNKGAAQFLKVLSGGRVDTTTHPAYPSTQNNGDHLSTPAPQVPEILKAETQFKQFVHHQPPASLVLHNPDNLTPEQVGPDHRLLCTVELDGEHREMQLWCGESWGGTANLFAVDGQTFRVPIPTPWPEVPQAEEKPEKWAAEKAAHAKGLKVQWRATETSAWHDADSHIFGENLFYRIAPGQETDPYAELKAAAEAGKWMQCKNPKGATWGIPYPCETMQWHLAFEPECYRVLSTITHDGKTYFQHTPGDEMPVGGDVEVRIFMESQTEGPQVVKNVLASYCSWDSTTLIRGYYPVSLAEALGNTDKPQPSLGNPVPPTNWELAYNEAVLAYAQAKKEHEKVLEQIEELLAFKQAALTFQSLVNTKINELSKLGGIQHGKAS